MQGHLKMSFLYYSKVTILVEYMRTSMNRNYTDKLLTVPKAYIPKSGKSNPLLVFICPVRQLQHWCLVILNVTLGRWCHLVNLYCMLGCILSIIVCNRLQVNWLSIQQYCPRLFEKGAAGIIIQLLNVFITHLRIQKKFSASHVAGFSFPIIQSTL